MFKLLERLAYRLLTRGERRVMLLGPEDSALLARNKALIATLASGATEDSKLGTLFIAALQQVGNDATGQLNLEEALVATLQRIKVPEAAIQTYRDIFLQERLRQQLARTQAGAIEESDGEAAS